MTREQAAQHQILQGCRPAVLDPRESSRILFETRLDALEQEYGKSQSTSRDHLYVAHCGEEFVLFSRKASAADIGADTTDDALYLRFQDGTFQLIDQHWG